MNRYHDFPFYCQYLGSNVYGKMTFKVYFRSVIEIKRFTFNPFQENSYVLWDETKECVIIDPGCYDASEQMQLSSFIANQELKPVQLLNTHCHIDHIFGNRYVKDKYNIPFYHHQKDEVVLKSGETSAKLYGLSYDESPEAEGYIKEGEQIQFGNSTLDIVFTPGHSPGSVCFISHPDKFVIGGDVLFRESIGRYDLPGGDLPTLLNAIRTQLFTLPEDFTVHPGHNEETTIGHEKTNNPFF